MARSGVNAQGSAAPAHERAASLDWGHLRYFLELTRTGSLSRAAQRLAVDRNTVARRIGALEEELGLALFERGPQGWTCTDAGKDLAELVSRVENDVLAIARHADAHDTALSGNVRLTTASHLSAHLLVPALPALRARHPGLLLEIAADPRAFDLLRREADLALRMGRPSDPGLVTRKLSDVAYRFYAGKGSPPAKRGKLDLARDSLVGFEESLARTPQERWLAKLAPDRSVVFRCNSTASLHAAARAGVGVAMLPCFAADEDPALVRLDGPEPPNHELWLLVHGDLRHAPRVRAVIEWVDGLVDAARPVLVCAS
jgi:DNA-binding transcriptional LysR family regulator